MTNSTLGITALRECRPSPRHIIISKWGKTWIFDDFLYPDGDPDHSQNLMGPKFIFFHEDPTSSICIILLTNRWTNGHENNISLEGVITV